MDICNFETVLIARLLKQPLWTRRAAAKEIGINKDTVKPYCKLAELIPDFDARVRRDEMRSPVPGYALDPYQVWVLWRVSQLMRQLNESTRGHNNYKQAEYYLIQDEAAKAYSYQVFRYKANTITANAA